MLESETGPEPGALDSKGFLAMHLGTPFLPNQPHLWTQSYLAFFIHTI